MKYPRTLVHFMNEDDGASRCYPPNIIHQWNAAERATYMFKHHFITCICGTDSGFNMKLWDKLLPQTLITLNLLRISRINPYIITYVHLYDTIYFNQISNASPYTNIVIHEHSDQRPTWSRHTISGFYLGPTIYHYIYYRVYIHSTQA